MDAVGAGFHFVIRAFSVFVWFVSSFSQPGFKYIKLPGFLCVPDVGIGYGQGESVNHQGLGTFEFWLCRWLGSV